MPRRFLLCLAAGAALAACRQEAASPPVPAPAPTPVHAFSTGINAADFAELVKTLASDGFEGRAPGSRGEQLTVEYIRDQMQRIGLQPGNGDSWFQEVPMTETIADPTTVLTLRHGDSRRTLAFGSDMVVGTRSGQPDVKIDASDMVFVGYGVDAPEQD
ncbi:MAG: aminopeptidase, partial [Stenotrophomonas acidaminiphila]|nr:aminopeptidase [Stenotrophomonas acidaminiphila]